MTEEKVHWARTTSMKSGFIRSLRKMRGNPVDRLLSGLLLQAVVPGVHKPDRCPSCPPPPPPSSSPIFLWTETQAPSCSEASWGHTATQDPLNMLMG